VPVAVVLTVFLFVPAIVPIVEVVDALPELSVTALSTDKLPAPPVTLNTTGTPTCALPKPVLTLASGRRNFFEQHGLLIYELRWLSVAVVAGNGGCRS